MNYIVLRMKYIDRRCVNK